MSEYIRLSPKAKEILEEGIINISQKELEKEMRQLDSIRNQKFDKKIHYDYTPEDIYVATELQLLLVNPELSKDKEKLTKETDEMFAKQLMRSVLIAISMEMESMGIEMDDYDNKVLRASYLLDGTPIAYYPNIIEWINEEEFSDCYYKGISFKKAYEANFPHIKEIVDKQLTQKMKYYYNKESILIFLNALQICIENNRLQNIYNRRLQDQLFSM